MAGCLAAARLLPDADIVVGIPLAFAAAYTAGLVAAAAILRRRLGRIDGYRLLCIHAQVAIAAALAGSCAAVTAHVLTPSTGPHVDTALVTLATAGAIGAAIYVTVTYLLRLTELRHLVATALSDIRPS